jgi:hypothetical protein
LQSCLNLFHLPRNYCCRYLFKTIELSFTKMSNAHKFLITSMFIHSLKISVFYTCREINLKNSLLNAACSYRIALHFLYYNQCENWFLITQQNWIGWNSM